MMGSPVESGHLWMVPIVRFRGAMIPVRPTFHSTSSNRVIFSSGGNL